MSRRNKPTNAGVHCGHCNHFMVTDGYSGFSPKPDTPAERIHRVSHPTLRGVSFLCICGHYTVTTDTWENKVIR